MELISEIEIKSFRSIKQGKLIGLDAFTAIAGLNNSGKSNLLRALNLFFNNETDVGKKVNVDEDFFRPDLRKKKAKRISVSITFSLPEQFKFRKGLEAVRALLGSMTFKIGKEWRRKDPLPHYYLNDQICNLDDQKKIDQFLQLINFRYIPNRVLPIDTIRNEHRALRDVLVRRLGSRQRINEESFRAIEETSHKMINSLAKNFKNACPTEGEIRLATPTSWNEMIFAFGYRLNKGGIELDDSVQGAGIQSLLMFQTLYLIDQDYFQKFGWQQAAIWAVEEPESSLHSSLEAQVASYLSNIASDPKGRLQILATTHSDLILQYANKVVIANRDSVGQTNLSLERDKKSSLDKLSRAGVSRWVHPLLYYPLESIIIVDGKYDAAFFKESLNFIRVKKPVKITYLEKLDGGERTGGSDLIKYIKENVKVIKSRSKDAPIILVLDWDDSKYKKQFEKLFEEDDPFKVLVWPTVECNPKLSRNFRGTERYYSDRMISLAESRGVIISRTRAGVCHIDSEEYNKKAKKIIYEIVKEGLVEDDFEFSLSFIKHIFRSAGFL